MKKILFIALLSTGLGGSYATKAADTATAIDTTGEHSMIKNISADMCRQLEAENKKSPLTKLSQDEAIQLFTRLMLASAANNPTFTRLIVAHKSDARSYGEQLGKNVATLMVSECPVSLPLFMKLGAQQMREKHSMSEQEIKLLTPIASAVCQNLEDRQKKQDLATLSAQERIQLLGETMQQAMKPYAKELSQFYGPDIFLDNKRMEEVGSKLAIQMAEHCPASLGTISGVGQSRPK
ncbi:hypothetical protein [Hymenobacter cavernae]|uniref:Uncharacterized protein n=1 Tax=Hymenobacter cavernae TaxID=2044852 RepID=A0ABQ1TRK7_9BACT|nr:hypothetical protein [Hymenobacter cavernae]GGF01245.1 hypothetical protein GCM10011383_10110 [Hymenobacter cavernae]